jgi:hypothetical protein
MRLRLRTLALALLPALLLVAPAPAAGRDEVIAGVADATPIDAYRGRVVWSERSSSGFQLVEYRNGKVGALPIAPAAIPFEVDLAPDRNGRVVAVYARCARAPVYEPHSEGPLGCDLYRYDFERGRETPIRGANSNSDELAPAIWRGRIAFIRNAPAGRQAYWRHLSGRGPNHRLGRAPPSWDPATPSDIDLRGVRAAIFWFGPFGAGEVRVVRFGGATRTVAKLAGAAVANTYTYNAFGISLAPGFVYWMVRRDSYSLPMVAELRRYNFKKRREERARAPINPYVAAFAQDGSTSYYLASVTDQNCAPGPFCPAGPFALHRLTGVGFERARSLEFG